MTDAGQTIDVDNDAFASRRKLALLGVASAFGVLAIAATAYWFFALRPYESTDDAYVSGNVVQVTPQVGGTVVSIAADDNDLVQAGQSLIVLDDADAKLTLQRTQAELARIVREVRSLFADTAALQADVRAHEAMVAKAQEDLNRRVDLAKDGAVSTEETEHARTALNAAQSALTVAREKLSANLAQTEGTAIENNPLVTAAAAKVREAYLSLHRTAIPAPISGYVAKRAVQIGQRVQPGAPLMAIVALNDLWVDANFKESQLGDMRIGQTVTLKSDIYGGSVVFHGRVAGVAAGTGGAFALLPAQNASGNWIKIVQRVPVRIDLDKKELQENPLRIGLSMRARVAVSDASGSQLANSPRTDLAYSTQIYTDDTKEADALIARIVAENIGRSLQACNAGAKAKPKSTQCVAHAEHRGI